MPKLWGSQTTVLRGLKIAVPLFGYRGVYHGTESFRMLVDALCLKDAKLVDAGY